ncbi:MAG: hypothetical protein LDLANPLL_00161 [Turneriella sp.]|nr:hypothetical protein [Turneriella sp.]
MRISTVLVLLFVFACAEKKVPEVWYCPMHTHYQVDHPGKCPICGMNLVKKEQSSRTHAADEHDAHGNAENKNTEHTITINSEIQSRLGIVTTKPITRKLSLKLNLAGEVAYEPDIYAAIIEYRQLLLAAKSLDASIGGGANLTQSALIRLEQLGLSKDEIHQYAHSQSAASRLITGSTGGKALITLRLTEADLAYIHKGIPVKITTSAYPGKIWNGKITAVGKLVDAKNRSISARALVKDNGKLAAQMAVTAELEIRAGHGVSIERSAIFDTGEKQIVFVKTAPTQFTPRIVRILGGNDDFALVSGLEAKDEVATSGTFLLDSEAKLKWGDTIGIPSTQERHNHGEKK